MVGTRKKDQLQLLEALYGELGHRIHPVWGTYPWPLIRVLAGYQFHLLINSAAGEQRDTANVHIRQYRTSGKRLIRLLKLRAKTMLLTQQLKGVLRNKVLLAGFADHISAADGKNIYIHPCKEALDSMGIQNELLFFQMKGALQNAGKLNELYDTCYVYQKERFALRNAADNSQNNAAFNNAQLVGEWFLSTELMWGQKITALVYDQQIEQQIRFEAFVQFLSITQPARIWTYCYYDVTIMAMIRAANSLKIPVVEYQHSAQYDDHFAYAKWNDADRYREYFPSRFWLWRRSDQERILRNFTGTEYHPQTVAGGNIFLAQQKKAFKRLNGQQQGIHILVSLQGMWIPPFMEDFIKKNNDYTWHFRLHPRYPQDKERLQQLQQVCGEKVETEEANRLSLYELFSKVVFNITAYSGTALEAHAFGVKNIIFSEEGYAAFGEYIRNNSFAFVTSEEELNAALSSANQGEGAGYDPVETDPEKMNQYLKSFVI